VPAFEESLAGVLAAKSYPGLRLLLLFGSRARGDAGAGADWDLAYLAEPLFDADGLLADVAGRVGADRVDLVDLARAGGQLRYRAARDGRVLFEVRPGEFERFWFDAVSFWCDVAPVVERAYEGVLSRLGR
jgi:predicted nucleotidyltransferase